MDQLRKIKNEMNTLVEQAFSEGRKFENSRINKMFFSIKDVDQSDMTPVKPKVATVKSTTSKSKSGGHNRRGRWLCENIIMGMFTEREIVTTAEAIRRCDQFSKPIVWSALRTLTESGVISRRSIGVYEKGLNSPPDNKS